ncbi:MFS transporter [Neobacillus niacini]|uniref:MFS transporter n=1 Tax=Neobacillus niacini TaxID=86668 RepID=UPI002FFE67E0
MEKRKFWSYENKLVALFFFSVGFVFFDRLAINYLIPFIQKDFTLTNTQIGLIGSALAITWAISGPLGGYLSDKVKSKKALLAFFVLGFSLVSLMHGLASSFATLFVLRLIMGIVEGPITPITQSILAVESSEKRRGFNMGLTMNTGNAIFGSFLAPLVIVALANVFDWHTAFYLTIIPGIILAIFIMKTLRNPQVMDKAINTSAAPNKKAGVKEVFKHRNMWLSIIIFSFFLIYVMSFNIFGPVFLVNAKGMSPGEMSLVMAAFGAGFAIFGILVPILSDRIGRKQASLIFGILSGFTPLVLIYMDSMALILVLVFLFSAGMGVGSLVMSTIPAETVPVQYAGVAVGLVIGIGELFGGFLNPMLSGMAADKWGLAAPLIISSSAAFLAFAFSLFLRETAPVKVLVNKEVDIVV